MKNMWVWVGVAALVLIGGYLIMNNNQPVEDTVTTPPTNESTDNGAAGGISPAMESIVMLSEQNDSGESGTVSMVESAGTVIVTVTMTGAPETAQPAHIHAGSCPTPGAVVYPLTDVVNGTSTTTLTTTLADLKAQMPLAVNVHKSAEESDVYVACGDVM